MARIPSVKRWWFIVLGAILVGAGIYIYLHRQDLGLTGNSEAEGPAPAHITWVEVDRSSDGFKLQMPANTQEIQVPAYNEKGGADPVDMIFSYPDTDTSFSIAWADNPPVERAAQENPDTTLNDARDGALARTETTLVNESKSVRNGYPTRDIVGRNDNGGLFNARLVLAGQRLYMLMASFPAASARRESDVNHFFDSFRVVTQPSTE